MLRLPVVSSRVDTNTIATVTTMASTQSPMNQRFRSSIAGNVNTKKPTSIPNCGSVMPKGDCATARRNTIHCCDSCQLIAPARMRHPVAVSPLKRGFSATVLHAARALANVTPKPTAVHTSQTDSLRREAAPEDAALAETLVPEVVGPDEDRADKDGSRHGYRQRGSNPNSEPPCNSDSRHSSPIRARKPFATTCFMSWARLISDGSDREQCTLRASLSTRQRGGHELAHDPLAGVPVGDVERRTAELGDSRRVEHAGSDVVGQCLRGLEDRPGHGVGVVEVETALVLVGLDSRVRRTPSAGRARRTRIWRSSSR